MITVHHLNHSRSQRVLWLLEELELPYELVRYERDPETMLAPKSLEAVHPLGKSPVIADGDNKVAESGAILEYVVETHGKGRLKPELAAPGYLDYRYFMHYAEGSLMPNLLLKLITRKIQQAKMPFFAKPIARKIASKIAGDFVDPNLRRHVAFLGAHLAKHRWFAGDELSAADIQMSYPMEAMVARADDLALPPQIADFVRRCKERPAYQRALARGRPPELPS